MYFTIRCCVEILYLFLDIFTMMCYDSYICERKGQAQWKRIRKYCRK